MASGVDVGGSTIDVPPGERPSLVKLKFPVTFSPSTKMISSSVTVPLKVPKILSVPPVLIAVGSSTYMSPETMKFLRSI